MVDIEERIQRAIEELTGNEALLEMLETEAAEEMLNWGIEMVNRIAKKTKSMDDSAAESFVLPRLKAVRQIMRSVGNWAAGKYVDPADRVQLRDKLIEYFRVIYGADADLPTAEEMDDLLNQVDDKQNKQQQLILNLKALLNETR